MRAATLAALVLCPGLAGAQEAWWQGVWAAESGWCAVAERIGSVTPAPIAITPAEVLGYENSCRITRVDEHAMVGAVSLMLECQSEGSVFDEARLIMNAGEAIWIWFGADEPIRFHRCPGPLPAWWPVE
ncbi:hypothetical protein [Marimonas lutisalis]|uniref:hypothetical protein n=1 Tax=Marimonas lutisalis TaxID=2545756 RepID=UPI0010F6EA58|nr:hypothetical protein [Marimonas lutisalis]